jgi:hypothetical protein
MRKVDGTCRVLGGCSLAKYVKKEVVPEVPSLEFRMIELPGESSEDEGGEV